MLLVDCVALLLLDGVANLGMTKIRTTDMKMGMIRNYLFVDCGTLFLVHSSTFLFLDGRALLFLNCVILGVANLRTGEDEENRENKGEKG